MSVLLAAQRKLLSDTVAEARDVVEAACAQRIAALGVTAERAPDALTEEERRLRRGLRARTRQLGSVEVLVSEAGYEHWHRMLFTRYLTDNNLLVDDRTGQPVTIEEVADYATELGEPDMWDVAAKFAAAMLPGIFRQDDPLLQMRLPVETRHRLEELLGSLPADVITAEDSLGWVYQYWQARRKDEVNRSERKIGGADLPPVTQLFTEDYMVRFLLENSLGAWWAARHPDSPLLREWEYLRLTDEGGPAAGAYAGWPSSVGDVTVMDPCCGSGHFLVAAFRMLWRMRAEEEGLDITDAQHAVLRDNLFGLELDPRCTQIATFALALDAWKTAGYRLLPTPHIACSGVPAKAPLAEWTELADGDIRLESALARLHALFASANTLGSLIDPIRAAEQADLESVDWHVTAPLLHKALRRDARGDGDPAAAVFGEAAAGIARTADYLTRRYMLCVTNPPFLRRNSMDGQLQRFVDIDFPDSRGDLATVFVERLRDLLASGGTQALVNPQNWLFLITYEPLRRKMLNEQDFRVLARLGSGAFEAITGEVVNPCLIVLSNNRPDTEPMMGITCIASVGPTQKRHCLKTHATTQVQQNTQLANPDARITLTILDSSNLLEAHAVGLVGVQTGDYPRYGRKFWERPLPHPAWEYQQSTVKNTTYYGGREHIVKWEGGSGALSKDPGAYIRGQRAWGKYGVAVSQMGTLPVTLFTGDLFDNNTAVILPKSIDHLPAIWAYCSSDEYAAAVRDIDDKMNVTNATLVKVPFDLERWLRVAAEDHPHGLPRPQSNDPTQWLFSGRLAESNHPLQVAVARLLGYSWPEQENEGLDELGDADGVVCLPAVGGEPPASDRLLNLLADAYGEDWGPDVLDSLLSQVAVEPGSTGLAAWLRNRFFKDHCKVFSNRPFIWQIWDGAPDGFSALVNYHRFDRKLLERLTYDYLGSWWLGRVRSDIANEIPGAERQLAAAEQLKDKLQLILEGEPPYDIYVRWKTVANQPTGWDPDLDDGVRLNIRPFVKAGVLRSQPQINWNRDRGRDSDGSDRLNDLHYTVAQKRAARGTSQ
jgi:hypothetical protein